MAIATDVFGQDPRTLESSGAGESNRLGATNPCCVAISHQWRDEISADQAWCGPGGMVALLAILATALLALIVVRIWLKVEKGASLILHLVTQRRAAH
jgi:hypothetical protein